MNCPKPINHKNDSIELKLVNQVKGTNVRIQTIGDHSLAIQSIELKEKRFKRDMLYTFLKDNQIASQVHYIPLYKHPIYKTYGFKNDYCKNAETYFSSCLSIPLHQKLNEDDINYVVEHIKKFLR